jgi:NADPH:quinone reductase-like Zn-dependent oxidoreductase
VVAAGPGVSQGWMGERVVYFAEGSYAEYTAVPTYRAFRYRSERKELVCLRQGHKQVFLFGRVLWSLDVTGAVMIVARRS